MTRPEILTKLDKILAEAEKTRMFGFVQLEIRNGHTVLIRTERTERTRTEESLGGDNRHEQRTYR